MAHYQDEDYPETPFAHFSNNFLPIYSFKRIKNNQLFWFMMTCTTCLLTLPPQHHSTPSLVQMTNDRKELQIRRMR